jgi:hypothetical protein
MSISFLQAFCKSAPCEIAGVFVFVCFVALLLLKSSKNARLSTWRCRMHRIIQQISQHGGDSASVP